MNAAKLMFIFFSMRQRVNLIAGVDVPMDCATNADAWERHWQPIKHGLQDMGYVIESLEARAAI